MDGKGWSLWAWFIKDSLDLQSSLVLVIGTTNRIDSIDPCLRRAGRFDKELSLGIPNESSRKQYASN